MPLRAAARLARHAQTHDHGTPAVGAGNRTVTPAARTRPSFGTLDSPAAHVMAPRGVRESGPCPLESVDLPSRGLPGAGHHSRNGASRTRASAYPVQSQRSRLDSSSRAHCPHGSERPVIRPRGSDPDGSAAAPPRGLRLASSCPPHGPMAQATPVSGGRRCTSSGLAP